MTKTDSDEDIAKAELMQSVRLSAEQEFVKQCIWQQAERQAGYE